VASVHDGGSLFADASEGAAWVVSARDLKTRIGAVRSTARGLDRALNDVLEGEGGGVLGVVQRSIAACKDAPAPTSEQARDRNRDAAALLIECHLLSLRNATKKLDAANGSLGGGEKFATILLDQNRNAIMKFDVVITAVTAFFAFGAMFTAIFGMNTPAHLFDPGGDPDKHSAVYGTAPRWAFPLVASLILGLTCVKVTAFISYFYCRPTWCGGKRSWAPPAGLAKHLSAAHPSRVVARLLPRSRIMGVRDQLLGRPTSERYHQNHSSEPEGEDGEYIGEIQGLDPVGDRF